MKNIDRLQRGLLLRLEDNRYESPGSSLCKDSAHYFFSTILTTNHAWCATVLIHP